MNEYFDPVKVDNSKKNEVGISCKISEEIHTELRERAHQQRRTQRSIIEEALAFLFMNVEK